MKDTIVARPRSWLTVGLLGLLVAVVMVPWRTTVYVPAVVVARDEFEVFAPRVAQVVNVNFQPEQVVDRGLRLVGLKSPELDFEIETTRQRLALSEAQLRRIAGDARDREERTVIEQELTRSREKLADLQRERSTLELVVPHAGVVKDVLRGFRVGDWVDAQTRIARVVGTEGTEGHGYLHEDDLWKIEVGQPALFVPEDPLLAKIRGRVALVSEAGADALHITYLSSVYGGGVPADAGSEGGHTPRAGQYFVQVDLEGDVPNRVVRGTLLLDGHAESLMVAAYRRVMQVLVREMNF